MFGMRLMVNQYCQEYADYAQKLRVKLHKSHEARIGRRSDVRFRISADCKITMYSTVLGEIRAFPMARYRSIGECMHVISKILQVID